MPGFRDPQQSGGAGALVIPTLQLRKPRVRGRRGLSQVHGWKQMDMGGAKACLSPAPV